MQSSIPWRVVPFPQLQPSRGIGSEAMEWNQSIIRRLYNIQQFKVLTSSSHSSSHSS